MYTIKEIDVKMARAIVRKYHYSGKVANNSSLHLGVFRERTLVGCLSYGPPLNGTLTISRYSAEGRAFELNRMVMRDEEPRNSESMAIAACNKWLRQNTDCRWLLSFSDGKEGNVGYIYQATNWQYLGYILSDSFYELDGEIVHSVTVYNTYKEFDTSGRTTNEILATKYENITMLTCKQFVYVLPLYKNVKFYHEEVRPYPKRETEPRILSRRWIQKEGKPSKDVEIYYDGELNPIKDIEGVAPPETRKVYVPKFTKVQDSVSKMRSLF